MAIPGGGRLVSSLLVAFISLDETMVRTVKEFEQKQAGIDRHYGSTT
jgi:hypothetical protein